MVAGAGEDAGQSLPHLSCFVGGADVAVVLAADPEVLPRCSGCTPLAGGASRLVLVP
ncbi:hypothetical protein [Couchioplanes caeruleus]|uniref:Uncharacterized protein n=1 Tax=Couchioplanes caeruleus TaxID=56438 RepID=A0A3N1GDB0_9ACTN|nr:hypothetical protein [Couchioplanes caeruleus]ROP28272.1 hypothetical protein EDD30_1008 [Couchioplanes caeruleus]